MIPWDAILYSHTLLLLGVAVVVVYALLQRRLADLAQPSRLRLAELGEKYLESSRLTRSERKQIEFYLDSAFSPWVTIAAAALLPILPLWVLIRHTDEPEKPASSEVHDQIHWLFTWSAFVANPLFGTIVVLEVLIFAVILILTVGQVALLRRAVAVFIDLQAGRARGGIPAH